MTDVLLYNDPDDRDQSNRVAWVLGEVLAPKLNSPVTWGDAIAVIKRLADGPDPELPWLPVGWRGSS